MSPGFGRGFYFYGHIAYVASSVFSSRPDQPEPDVPYLTAAHNRYSISPHRNMEIDTQETKRRQSDAWFLYDCLAEVHMAARLTSNTLALAEFCPAKSDGCDIVPLDYTDEDLARGYTERSQEAGLPDIREPIDPTDAEAARIGQACFNGVIGKSSQSYVLRLIAENLYVAGEAWLVQAVDERTRQLVNEFEVVSPDRITTQSNSPTDSQLGMLAPNTGEFMPFRDDQTVLRFVYGHPKSPSQPTSSVFGIIPEGMTLILLRQLVDATARSAIHNSMLLLPDELSLEGTREEFHAEMIKALSDPINNPKSIAQIVPMLLFGKAEYLEEIRHLDLSRDFDSQVTDLILRIEGRVRQGLDIPIEVLEGIGTANHWSSWAINANWVRNHIQPILNIILDTLTRRVYWPKLQAAGIQSYEKYCFSADTTMLAGQPNLAKNALDAHRAGALSHEALLRYLGFSPSDMADPIRIAVGGTPIDPLANPAPSTERRDGVNPDRPDEGNSPTQGEDENDS